MLRTLLLMSYSHNPQAADGTHQTSMNCSLTIRICPTVDQMRIRKKKTQHRRYKNAQCGFEISIDFFLYFRPSRMIGGAAGLQAVLAPEV